MFWRRHTVKTLYNGHLRFLKKVSAIRRCPLYRVLDFFEEKFIIDRNLIINRNLISANFHVNCDSLQIHFSKNIQTVLCLTFCTLSASTFRINSFSTTFICLSPWISAKHFTTSRLSRVSDADILFIISNFFVQFIDSNSTIWLQDLCNAVFSAFLFPSYVCWISSCLWCNCLPVKADIFIKCSFTINLWKKLLKFSVPIFSFMTSISSIKPTFFKALLDGLHGHTFASSLKPFDYFQYVNVLNYLRSHFRFIDTTNDVKNKQLPVFIFETPDDTGVIRLQSWCCIFG